MSSATPSRFFGIDYLRGLASLAVAWFHLTNTYDPGLVRASGSFGWLGVEVFFVISGFVIPWAVRGDLLSTLTGRVVFIARRATRVELPYIVSIVLVLALWHLLAMQPSFAGGAPSWTPGQVGLHIVYLIPLSDFAWLQPVYWTLAWEFAFYLFVAAFFPWTIGAKSAWLWWSTVLATLLSIGFGLVPFHAGLFVMGAAVFRIADGLSGMTEGALVLFLAWVAMLVSGGNVEAIAGVTTAVAIIFIRDVRVRGLVGSVLLGLGSVSYSLYLVHVPVGGRVVNLGRRFIEGGAMAEFLLSLLALAVSIGFAWVFYRLVEKPAHAFARRLRLRQGRLEFGS
jgi:peptidoglycan/LPS O-acetylase OafA/YrhL